MIFISQKTGFTLIETAVVIIILGVIMVAGLQLYHTQLEQKRQQELEQRFRNIQAALTNHLDEKGFSHARQHTMRSPIQRPLAERQIVQIHPLRRVVATVEYAYPMIMVSGCGSGPYRSATWACL